VFEKYVVQDERPVMTAKIVRDAAIAVALLTLGMAPVAAEEKTLMLYGDSLMAGLGLSEANGFAGQLQQALGDEVTIVNASVSGDTSADGLARLDWSLGERPDAVILGLGANDMLQGLPVEAMRDNLSAILERFEQQDIPVLLAGMRASPSLGTEYATAYDAVFSELAQQYEAEFYPFFLEGVATDPALNQSDGMHPNTEGVRRIVEAIRPSVEALLSD
jgi:acyl-CoA thioesterase-1